MSEPTLIDDEQAPDKKSKVVLRGTNVKKYFPIKKGLFKRTVGYVKAVDDVSIEIYEGETFGLVGESGSGKSTLGRVLLKLHEPTSGEIEYHGEKINGYSLKEMQSLRRDMQIVYQDPFSALDPRYTVENIVGEPLDIHRIVEGKDREKRIIELLELVGIDPRRRKNYPHAFSGGQRQRISIARAIALNPKLILADEAVSALDVSVQAQIINLLIDLQRQFNITYLFIAHGLNVVRHVSDRVGVMYLGKLVEVGDTDTLYNHPAHPYTKALLSTNPIADPRRKEEKTLLEGEIPSPSSPPSGCSFHTRCPIASEYCKVHTPTLEPHPNGQQVACHYPLDGGDSMT